MLPQKEGLAEHTRLKVVTYDCDGLYVHFVVLRPLIAMLLEAIACYSQSGLMEARRRSVLFPRDIYHNFDPQMSVR
jgi:hypothetical protein